MRLSGLDASSLALTLLACALALLWLYRQTRPSRRVLVPSLALWRELAPARKRPSVLRSRRHWLLSLLLAALIVCALVFAIAQPERTPSDDARHLVLMIDDSPSMAATDVKPSRLEQAKALARRRVAALGERDQAWVVALGEGATPLTPLTRDKVVLLHAIDGLTLQPRAAGLGPAAQLAISLLADLPRAQLRLFSDGALRDREAGQELLRAAKQIEVVFERVGQSARNVGLTELAARPYLFDHAHQEVLVSLENFGTEDEPLTLQLFADDALLREQALTLEARGRARRVWSDLPAGAASLHARIVLAHGVDALPRDDRASLQMPARKPLRVLSVSSGNRYLEAALLLDETLEVDELRPDAYRGSAGYDLVIFDGALPTTPPDTAVLYLAPGSQGGAFPLARAGELVRPFFDRIEHTHPLLIDLALSDVNVARAARLSLGPGDRALVATQEREPLIVEGLRDGHRFLVVGFDLRESDLPLRAAFPLFFLRALERLTGTQSGSAVAVADLRTNDSAIEPVAELFGPEVGKHEPSLARVSLLDRLWPLLLGLALVLLLFEWLSFHRGWTA